MKFYELGVDIKVTYIEDYAIVKEGLNFLLSQIGEIKVINIKSVNESDIVDSILLECIDVVVLDLYFNKSSEMTIIDSFKLCEEIKKHSPQTKIVAHSMYDNVYQINKILMKGADGFVSKNCSFSELAEIILSLKTKQRVLCSQTLKKIKNADEYLKGRDNLLKSISEIFTKTEKMILEKIAKGYSNKEISAQLNISNKTVESHRRNLFEKTRVKNVSELIAFCYSRGILVE